MRKCIPVYICGHVAATIKGGKNKEVAMLSVYNQIVFDLIGNDKRQENDINPFSFKNFLSDDLASRNKRVLQVYLST